MKRTDSVFKIRKVNDRLEDILKYNRVYLASPTKFNDPFDASILPITEIADENFRQWFEEQIENNRQLTEAQRSLARKSIESGEYKSEAVKKGIVTGWKEGLKEYGICSFAKNVSNILLWSHYGDNHKGVAVGIEIQKLDAPDHSVTEIHYSSEYPKIKMDDPLNYQEALRRKYLAWAYEEEVRILKFGGAGHHFDLPNGSIKQVIFGMKCTEEDFFKVMNWINWDKMNPDIIGAYPKSGRYELGFFVKARRPGEVEEKDEERMDQDV